MTFNHFSKSYDDVISYKFYVLLGEEACDYLTDTYMILLRKFVRKKLKYSQLLSVLLKLHVRRNADILRVNYEHLSWYYGIPITSRVTSQTTTSICVSPFWGWKHEMSVLRRRTELQAWDTFWWYGAAHCITLCRDALPVLADCMQQLYFRFATRPAECQCKDRHYVSCTRNVLLQSETRSAERIRVTLEYWEIKRAKKWNTAPALPRKMLTFPSRSDSWYTTLIFCQGPWNLWTDNDANNCNCDILDWNPKHSFTPLFIFILYFKAYSDLFTFF